jgi:hypothetical protein
VLDPLHYLATLDRKPGALDHAPVYRDWKLPACFTGFRAELERLHGETSGARRYVRVLQLLGEHPLTRVRQAIEVCRAEHLISAEAVIQRTQSMAAIEAVLRDPSPSTPDSPAAARVHVPLPDLKRFDQLLGEPLNRDDSSNDQIGIQSRDTFAAGQVTVIFA